MKYMIEFDILNALSIALSTPPQPTVGNYWIISFGQRSCDKGTEKWCHGYWTM